MRERVINLITRSVQIFVLVEWIVIDCFIGKYRVWQVLWWCGLSIREGRRRALSSA